jgi:phage tail-like protein
MATSSGNSGNSAPSGDGPYAAAHFAFELDGKDEVGLFRSIEGGGVKADVMTYQHGGGYDRWRQLGKPKFEDIKLQVGMSMSQPFYNWISDFFKGVATRKTGAIVAADFYYNERARRNFKEAMIKELGFPKLDGADKNAAYMTVAIAVEDIEFVKGSGKKLSVPIGFDTQKLWTACNFDFRLDDYADACRNVTKVDAFTVKQNIAEYHAGGYKAAVKTPTAVEFPNITFYVPEADAQPFFDHMAKRVGYGGKGNGEVRPATKMHGQIDTHDSQHRTLFTLEYFGADIVSVTPDRSDASSEEVKQVKVELYTEKMTFTYPVMELE